MAKDLLLYTDEQLEGADPAFVQSVIEAREAEIRACHADFGYFARRWVRITHPKRGLIPFNLYEYQERMVDDYETYRFNIISKFRQGGATTTTVLWCLWKCLFFLDQTIEVVSIGDREAINAGKIVKNAIDKLPDWMQPEMSKNNDHEKSFAGTNSIIYFFSPKAARGMALTYLIVDEAAFITKMEDLWAGLLPTLSAGGSCIVISTVNGVGNWYEETYHGAIDKKNPFHVIEIDYREHPDYRAPHFAKTMREALGEKKWLQEFERDFQGTGETYIEAAKLTELAKKTLYEEPLRRIFPEWDATKEEDRPKQQKDENVDFFGDEEGNSIKNIMANPEYVGGALWIWREPEPGREYILSADVAEGIGDNGDFSAFSIIDVKDCDQVAEFYSNQVPPHVFAQIISQMGIYYNTAHVVVENMGPGMSVLSRLQHNLFYENLHYDQNEKAGIRMGPQNRPIILESLQYAINANIVKIRSRRLVRELKTFIYNRSKKKAEAQKNKHDDAVIALAIGLYIRSEQVRHVPVMAETIADNLNEQFETDLYERLKMAILEKAPRDYLSIDEDYTKFKDEKEVLPGVIFGFKRPNDALLKEFGF